MTETAPSRRRRGWRDWAADFGLFALAVMYGLIWLGILEDEGTAEGVLFFEEVLGVVGLLAIWFRRRWPVGIAIALIPFSSIGDVVDGAQLVALFTVALYRPVKTTLLVAGAAMAGFATFLVVYSFVGPRPDDPLGVVVAFNAVLTFGVVGWGLFIRHRRQLVLSLRERAVRAEAEARLRAEQSQARAREEIAREMHDVLGHRLSLLSVHAGALEFRPDAPASEIAEAAGVIRASAHQALQDLREVIGVLRAPVRGDVPQPTLADVHGLVTESAQSGTVVELRSSVEGTVPDGLGRTAYRIVQEGLTNARKHAPGAPVTVLLAGSPGSGLSVEVLNAASVSSSAPGSGQGLLGLAERAALASGRLEYGPTAGGGFRLAAWLPWPA
jgi:signal transduction histidine kinase